MVQGGMSVVKFLVFAFNFVFVVCGIALIAVGAIVQTSGKRFTVFLDSKFLTAPTIIIGLGCIIFFIAFLGCFGALKQNYCMVMTFAVLLLLIFIIEIAAGIAAYVYRQELDNLVQENMRKSLKNYIANNESSLVWDDMQRSLKCCGVDGPDDYYNATVTLPVYCCKPEEKEEECVESRAYKEGCYSKLKDLLKGKIAMVGAAGIVIACIELLGMIFAWCLASAIKKEYEGV